MGNETDLTLTFVTSLIPITDTSIATLEGHGHVYSVLFSPDGTTLASSGSRDGTVKLWDVATHENIATLEGHTHDVNSVSFSPDGTTLASGSRDNTVKLWDVATRTNIVTLEGIRMMSIPCRFRRMGKPSLPGLLMTQ